MKQILNKKLFLSFGVMCIVLVAIFSLTTLNSTKAYAKSVDKDPEISVADFSAGVDTPHWDIVMESSRVQTSEEQIFTSETLKEGMAKLDSDSEISSKFWDWIGQGKKVCLAVSGFTYIAGQAVTEDVINSCIADKIVKHKSFFENGFDLYRVEFWSSTWTGVHLEEENCICDYSKIEELFFQHADFCHNAFGKNMPKLKKAETDNGSDNYTTEKINNYVNPGVKIGFIWDAKTRNPFTLNYRYTYNGNGSWTQDRI